MEKQTGLEGVLTMTPTVMKFLEEMLDKKKSEILGATSPEIREIIEKLLIIDEERNKPMVDPLVEKALAQPKGLPTNGFNI